MPESNAAAKRREQKKNREMGLGDEMGRMVRQKDPPKLSLCTICQQEMKITKTNTELTMHATGKHSKTLDECFPGAAATAVELIAASNVKSTGKGGSSSGGAVETKAEKKKKAASGMDDMLSAGLGGGPGATKKKGKK
jgi:hypothetical protein